MNKVKLMKSTTSYHDELIQALHNPVESFTYLKVALEEYQADGNVEALLIALRNVAEAKGGIKTLAEKTQLNRQNLYKTLSKHGNPRLDTFGLILRGLGYQLSIQPAANQ